MALEQTVKDLQAHNAQFQEMILNLSKGQEELKALLLEKKHEAQVDTVLMPYTQTLPCLLEASCSESSSYKHLSGF